MFQCTYTASRDQRLLDACKRVLPERGCKWCDIAWKFHRYEVGADVAIVGKMAGGGGRMDYYIVVACNGSDGNTEFIELGYVYHTAHYLSLIHI